MKPDMILNRPFIRDHNFMQSSHSIFSNSSTSNILTLTKFSFQPTLFDLNFHVTSNFNCNLPSLRPLSALVVLGVPPAFWVERYVVACNTTSVRTHLHSHLVFDLHHRSCFLQLQLHPVPAFADELGDVEMKPEERTDRVRGRVGAHLSWELVAVAHNLVVVVCRSMVVVRLEREMRPPLKAIGLQTSCP
jgi:hypothetical protein